MVNRKKLTLKISRYLLLFLPKGYITRHEYLQHLASNNRYVRDKSLKQFLERGYIEYLPNRKIRCKDEYVELDVYTLTPKGLLCIKKDFSELYPWLSYVDVGDSESYFRKNFAFDLTSIEQSKIGGYVCTI